MVKVRFVYYEFKETTKAGWRDFVSVFIVLSLINMLIAQKTAYTTSISILLIACLIGIYFSNLELIKANLIDLAIGLIFIYETVSYFIRYSFLGPGLEYEQEATLVFLFYILLRIFLNNRRRWFLFSVSLLLFIFTITFLSHVRFLFFDIQVTDLFPNDVSHFKAFFAPYNYLINDWSAILLCFLCFVFVAVDFLKNVNFIIWLVIFVVVGILTTFSRGAYLSLLLALPVMFFILKTHHILRFSSINFFFVLLCVFFLLLPFLESILKTCQFSATHSQIKSIGGRYNLLSLGVTLFLDHFFWGVGSGNFSLFASHYFEGNNIPFTSRVTNSFVQALCEKGLIGTLIWILPIVSVLYLWKKREIAIYPVVAMLAVICILAIKELTFSTFFESLEMKMMVILFFAYLCYHYTPQRMLRTNKSISILVLTSILISILAVIIISVTKQKADNYNNFSFTKQLSEESLLNAKKAFHLFPSEGAYSNNISIIYWKLYLEKSNQSFLDSAELYCEKSIAKTPFDFHLQNNLNWIYFYKGKTNLAINKMNYLVSKFPNNSLYLLSLAEMYKRLGNIDNSVYFYKQASMYSPAILENLHRTDFELYKKVAEEIMKRLILYNNPNLINNTDPIQLAKDAQLFLIMNNPNNAELLLNKATSSLPNLSRPYLFLALINLQNKDYTKARANIKRSLWLNNRDYLTLFYKNKVLNSSANSLNSQDEFELSFKEYQSMRSLHYEKTKKWYSSRSFKNDIIPQDFLYKLDYILPDTR
jgi:tetratricopeptide (TPR) repeat protein